MTQRMSANRYAKALFDVALAEDDPEVVDGQLAAVVGVFTGHDDLWRVVTNPAVPVQKKRALVDALLPELGIQPVVAKLIGLLADRDRLILLPDLLEGYRARLLDHLQVVRAHVTTAVPLAPERADAIQHQLSAITGRRVQMETATNPGIMGGVVARVGSTVYDGSVKRQLDKMREHLAGAL